MKSKILGLLAVALLAGPTGSLAAAVTVNFSDYAGLAYGTGTNQTISQNGVRLQALQGLYEVTYYPEVNLKDFSDAGATREIQLDLLSGLNFDFEGFSIRDLCCRGAMTLTSSKGGSFGVSGFSSPTFSGALWEDVSWVRFTYGGQYSEAKFTSFTLNDAPTVVAPVPLPAAAWLLMSGLAGIGFVGRRRKA